MGFYLNKEYTYKKIKIHDYLATYAVKSCLPLASVIHLLHSTPSRDCLMCIILFEEEKTAESDTGWMVL